MSWTSHFFNHDKKSLVIMRKHEFKMECDSHHVHCRAEISRNYCGQYFEDYLTMYSISIILFSPIIHLSFFFLHTMVIVQFSKDRLKTVNFYYSLYSYFIQRDHIEFQFKVFKMKLSYLCFWINFTCYFLILKVFNWICIFVSW